MKRFYLAIIANHCRQIKMFVWKRNKIGKIQWISKQRLLYYVSFRFIPQLFHIKYLFIL